MQQRPPFPLDSAKPADFTLQVLVFLAAMTLVICAMICRRGNMTNYFSLFLWAPYGLNVQPIHARVGGKSRSIDFSLATSDANSSFKSFSEHRSSTLRQSSDYILYTSVPAGQDTRPDPSVT